MSDLTQILNLARQGDPLAAERLWPLVYDELRQLAAAQMAGERPGHTLNATGLVHEAYLRLMPDLESTPDNGSQGGEAGTAARFANQRHFFAAAAEAMRRILVDHARKKRAAKRGGGERRFELSEADRIQSPDPDTLLCIDEALEALAAEDAAAADVARLRLFAALSIEEAAAALGISRATAYREWSYARAYLAAALTPEENSRNS